MDKPGKPSGPLGTAAVGRNPGRPGGRMKTVAVISQKGGAGKTTMALHLAVASALSGKNTAVNDLDRQASAANWADRRETEVPVVLSAHASRLRREVTRVAIIGGEMLYLDTAPHSDGSALEAAKLSDLVLIPCRPAILDLDALNDSLDFIRTAHKPICVVLNAIASVGHDADNAIEALKGLRVDICPVRLGHRVAFARSLITGQVAQEFDPKGKAAGEMGRLHQFVQTRLGLM